MNLENREPIKTKKDIIRRLATQYNLSQEDTKNIVQGTFDSIIESILTNERIELRNFGVFEVRHRAARKARNPKTGHPVYVPPKKVVNFKPGRLMEQLINKKDSSDSSESEEADTKSEPQPATDSPFGTLGT